MKLGGKKNEISKCFYICYIINETEKSIDEAISYLEDFIKRKKTKKNISIPRFLIQKSTRDELINELNQSDFILE